MTKPNVIIYNETKQVFLDVTGTTVAVLPNYSGSEHLEPGTILQTLAALDANKAERDEVPTLTQFDEVRTNAEEARNAVDGFGAQLEGLQTGQADVRSDVDTLESTVQNLNTAGLTDLNINSANELIASYTSGDPINFGFFPALPTYKGSVTATPTSAGVQGDFYLNLNPALDIVGWLCVTSGAAGTAVFRTRGGKVYEDMAFEFVSNDTYDYPVATARTLATPNVFGAAATVAWSYAVGTGAFGAATFPLSMVAGSVLRATVTGLAAGAKRYAALARTA